MRGSEGKRATARVSERLSGGGRVHVGKCETGDVGWVQSDRSRAEHSVYVCMCIVHVG